MAVCYNKLWKLLIDKNMKKKDLRLATGISTTALAKLGKNEHVSTVIVAERSTFGEICKQVRIVYGEGKAVGLLDIIPAAYYTSGGEEYFDNHYESSFLKSSCIRCAP